MGRNKALLNYNGRWLIQHMLHILTHHSLGITHTVISGAITGYDHICVADTVPFAGPAYAMQNIITQYTDYDGYMVIPVDMPLLSPEIIKCLLQHPQGAMFTGYPLPAYVVPPIQYTLTLLPPGTSVNHMLYHYKVPAVGLPDAYIPYMKNTNTPEQWQKVVKTCR